MNKLKRLQHQEKKTESKLNSIRNQISRIESATLLPLLKKKYEGKYFKCRNSYSCPKDDSERWWMYMKIEKVDQLHQMSGCTFQTDMYGRVIMEQKPSLSEAVCEIEITKKEFDAAYKKILKRIGTIFEGRG
jgi:hypothetical protein